MSYSIRYEGVITKDETLLVVLHRPFALDFVVSGEDSEGNSFAKIGDEYEVVTQDGSILFDKHIYRVEFIDDKDESAIRYFSKNGFEKYGDFTIGFRKFGTDVILKEIHVNVQKEETKTVPITSPIPKPMVKESFLKRNIYALLFLIMIGIGVTQWTRSRLNPKPTIRISNTEKDVSQKKFDPHVQNDQSINVSTPITQLPKEVTKTTDVKKDPTKPIPQPVSKKKSGMRSWESTCKFIDCR